MPFDYEKVKNILACPRCKSSLVHDGDSLVCVNPEAMYSYPIVDDIPRLLPDEATQLSAEQWGEAMFRHGRDRSTGLPVSENA